jgi:chromosome segregation ATPase
MQQQQQQEQQQQLDAADMALDVALSAVEALRRQWSADSTALATRLGNVRKQASSLRDVAEASRWDVAGASETAAQEAITVLAAAEQHVRSSHAILETDAMPVQLQTSDSQDVWALQEALDAAHRRCAELTAAAAQGQAARDALSVHEAQLADALSRAQEAEHLAVSLKQSHVFAEEALRAAHSRRTALEAQVAEMQRRLETAEGIASSNKSGGIFAARPPPQSEADWLSEAGFSDASSALGTGELVDPARVRKQREEARARAAANKARFEAIRQERNALRMQARSTAAELEAMRAEVSRVAELKQQLTNLEQSAFFN